jgi:epoxyqueuosine reductase
MGYLSLEPAKRLNPTVTFPGMRSVITVGVSYYQGAVPPKPGAGYGRVARYAWGLDYHPLIVARLDGFSAHVKRILNTEVQTVTAVDTKPLLERALARAAGMGFTGKNTLHIVPRGPRARFHVGSFLFLGEILVGTDVAGDETAAVQDDCGGCTKCLTACPTEAFQGPYQLDAQKCIAYLTIENKRWVDRSMREKMGDWVFGCDKCQDVCPFNARALESRWPEFRAERGVGPWIRLSDILSTKTTAEFKARWGHTPLSRPKRYGLVRNACIAAGNSQDESLVPVLEDLLSDDEAVVRGHALWALSRLENHRARTRAESLIKTETDEHMRNECQTILSA